VRQAADTVSLVLVRHGRTAWNRERRLVGRSDVALDEVGRDQARGVGELLGDVVELRTSPLRRARETAELFSAAPAPIVDESFIELDYGEAEGRRIDEVEASFWAALRDDATQRWPGGESLADVQARVASACEALFADDGAGARRDDGDVVVVSHVSPIKAAVAWAIGAPATVALHLRLDNASLTRIGWGPAGPVLLGFNQVGATPSRDR
jgi:probable phosphoglycerate mutase